jgi:5-oxoprolinase (ATP-hydrolysing) subunit A
MFIDLNCDLGEGMMTDVAIMPYISSANIACGYHAGDEITMLKTIEYCQRYAVTIGAHPGFDDKANFGRTPMQLSNAELYSLVVSQLELLDGCCRQLNARLNHVKPHGAMYTMAAKNKSMSAVIAKAVKDYREDLIYVGMSGTCMITEAIAIGLRTASEVFADRRYQTDGMLTPRTEKNALIESKEESLKQVMNFVRDNPITSVEGKCITLQADTICLHGDGAHAVEFAKYIHDNLIASGINIQPIESNK